MTNNSDRARVRAIVLALASAFAAAAQGVHAQVTAAAPASSERIEVTGSNIKRVEGETALPVTVITRDQIERTGATSAYELMNSVSANSSLGNASYTSVIGATTFSANTASLRGLTGGRTLVLINGHRVNGFAGEINGVQGVNLSVIPITAIERVEVLKDGASAVYGSDAIAGVINFILRSDYRGAEVSAFYGSPTRSGGGQEQRYAASVGIGELDRDRYNFFLALEYDKQKHLDQVDRNFSNTSVRDEIGLIGISSNTFPGRIATGGIGVPSAPNCAPSIFFNDPIAGLHGCFYDPAADKGVQSIPDIETKHVFASGKFKFAPSWTAYGHGLYAEDENRFKIQPVPVSRVLFYGPNSDIPMAINLPPSSPFYPHALAAAAGVDGQPLDIRYRAYENGPRDTTDKNKGMQLVGGVSGSIAGRWDTDVSYTYSEGKVTETLNGGFPLAPQLLALLNSGRVNPFGYNTPAIQQELLATNFNGQVFNGKSTNSGVQAKISGDVWALPAGSIAVAVGGEARREKLNEDTAAVLATGSLTGFGGNIKPVSGSRDVTAFYGEVNVPILRTLELNAALRTDDYSDFGRTTNPKFALRFQPNRDILLRTSYGKGFLAPSLFQLFNPQIGSVTPSGTSDPIRCPVTQNQGVDCLTQFPITFGGNPGLQPEKSEQATFGVVFEPTTAFSVSADYFKIRLDNTITNGVPIATILGDLNQYGSYVTRGPVDPAFPQLPGVITNIRQTFVNLGAVHIEGYDVEAHYRWPRTTYGRFRADLSGTYYKRYDVQATDGSWGGVVSNSFQSPVTGVIPRWKHYASVTWDMGPWTATVAQNYQTSYTDVSTDLNGNLREVGSLSLFDVQGSYTGFRNLKLTLGVKNVLDTNPPATNQRIAFQAGYDPSYYDARARFLYGQVSYAFK
jgi:iron complex outermembrane recepter protein